PGQMYELSDGERVWLGRIEKVGRERVEFSLVEPIASRESALEAALLLSIVKFDSFEWALEKATELGVRTIIPVAADSSEKALLNAAGKRAERWKKILLEAAQQSRRLKMPELSSVEKPSQAFARSAELKLIFSERAEAKPLKEIVRGVQVKQAV